MTIMLSTTELSPEMSHGRQVMTIMLCTTELSPRNEPWKAGYDYYAVYYRTITQK